MHKWLRNVRRKSKNVCRDQSKDELFGVHAYCLAALKMFLIRLFVKNWALYFTLDICDVDCLVGSDFNHSSLSLTMYASAAGESQSTFAIRSCRSERICKLWQICIIKSFVSWIKSNGHQYFVLIFHLITTS